VKRSGSAELFAIAATHFSPANSLAVPVFSSRAHLALWNCIKMSFLDAHRKSVVAPPTRPEDSAAYLVLIAQHGPYEKVP
jgi:hypothetical protein